MLSSDCEMGGENTGFLCAGEARGKEEVSTLFVDCCGSLVDEGSKVLLSPARAAVVELTEPTSSEEEVAAAIGIETGSGLPEIFNLEMGEAGLGSGAETIGVDTTDSEA